jgi:hypothetical protein
VYYTVIQSPVFWYKRLDTHEVYANIVTNDSQGVNNQNNRYQRLKKTASGESEEAASEKEIP